MNAALGIRSILFLAMMTSCIAWADSVVSSYAPLGSWSDSRSVSLEQWESVRGNLLEAPRAEGRRPVIFGVSGRNLELLQDAVARKKFRAIAKANPGTEKGDLVAARRYLSLKTNLSTLRGDMAEAVFLDKHPEYRYVGKPNASQHDVYRPNPTGGRGIHTGQIKFHISGNPSIYANDMIKDYRSKDFFVPDDHADALRAHLRARAQSLQAAGRMDEAAAKWRDANRVKPIGATSGEIDAATRQAVAEAKMIRVTPYISIGVASVLAVAPTAFAWYQGEMSNDNALYYTSKSASLMGAGMIADHSLRLFKGGLLRGTLRGNALVAVVVLGAETSWSIYEHGGLSAAVQSPEFVMHLSGGVGAAGLGIVGGYAGASLGGAVGAFAGPPGAFVGAVVGGVTVGGATGIAGYIGGHETSRWVLKKFAPERLFQQETIMVHDVIAGFDTRIVQLQKPASLT